MSSETDHPQQRTVAELLAAHGDSGATGRRHRRRAPEGPEDGGAASAPPSDGGRGGATITEDTFGGARSRRNSGYPDPPGPGRRSALPTPDRSVLREPVPRGSVPDRSVLREPVPREIPPLQAPDMPRMPPVRRAPERPYGQQYMGAQSLTGPDRNAADRFGGGNGSERHGVDRNGVDRNGTDRTGTDRTGTDRTGADRTGADRNGTDRNGVDRPRPERPVQERGPAERPYPSMPAGSQALAAPERGHGQQAARPVPERATEQMPRLRDAHPVLIDPDVLDHDITGPIDLQRLAALDRARTAEAGPDVGADGDIADSGPSTMVGAAPAGAEAWHRARTARRGAPVDDEGGPPTQASSALDFDDLPAGLGRHDDDEDDEFDAPQDQRRLGRAAESSPGQAWAAVVAQWIIGAIGGAALWVGFRFLWRELPVVALAAAVLVTVGLVVVVRALLRNSDLRTTLFAVAVGLLLTVSPAILVLLGR